MATIRVSKGDKAAMGPDAFGPWRRAPLREAIAAVCAGMTGGGFGPCPACGASSAFFDGHDARVSLCTAPRPHVLVMRRSLHSINIERQVRALRARTRTDAPNETS